MGQNPTNVGLAFLCWAATYTLLAPLVGYIGDKTVSFPFSIAKINFASGSGIITITKSALQKLSLTRQAFAGRGQSGVSSAL